MPLLRILTLLLVLLHPPAVSAAASAVVSRDHLRVQLLSEYEQLRPGQPLTLGLRLEHDPHWHTYWVNPGDSGLPTRFRWSLPEGVEAGPILWPIPKRFDLPGLVNLGYDGRTILLSELRLPADWPVGRPLAIRLRADWLICELECIPGDAELELELPVGDHARASAHAETLTRARDALPRPAPAAWTARYAVREGAVDLVLSGDLAPLSALDDPEVFVANPQVVAYGGVSQRRSSERVELRFAKNDFYTEPPEALELVWVGRAGDAGRIGLSVRAAFDAGLPELDLPVPAAGGVASLAPTLAPAPEAEAPARPPGPDTPSLLRALLLALLGGVLLNLMPCVFPVLSLKALSLAESGADLATARRHAWAYTAGVVSSFALLGLAVVLLRAGGQALGWGFQLQSAWFVAALAYLMFLIGLNLSGVVGFGAGWTGLGQGLTERRGWQGAFFTGVLACVVASPCTAPFMGSALGYAVQQPTPHALAVFIALGLGLALPFLLIGLVPALARRLPRPGHWMDLFKQVLAFPMYLTAVWLLWVLGQQTDLDTVAIVLVGAVVLSFGLWWRERIRYHEPKASIRVQRALAWTLVVLALSPVLWLGRGEAEPTSASTAASAAVPFEPYRPERLAALRAAGTPVLVNMTAAWCATCKVNERVALSSTEFRDTLARRGIVYMKGDWTHRDAAITEFLQQFGVAGVPLYVLYPRGTGAPEVLPQILTPGTVREALERAHGPPESGAMR